LAIATSGGFAPETSIAAPRSSGLLGERHDEPRLSSVDGDADRKGARSDAGRRRDTVTL
jgi:hypothetical protein